MNTPDEELAATETGSSTSQTRSTKRQHDESDEDETENSQIHKRQRVDDEIISEGIQNQENPHRQTSSITANPDTTEPNTHQPALGCNESAITLTHRPRVDDEPEQEEDIPNSENHDEETSPTVLSADPTAEYTNQAEPTHTGEWEERDWTTLTIEELFSNPAWDYTLDPLFEPQPFEPTPWFPDDNQMICGISSCPIPTQSDVESAGLQAEHSAGVEVLDEHLFSPDTTSSSLFMDSRHSLGSQTTEFTFLSSPRCAAPSVQGHQSPSSEQTSFQTSNSSAVFEPELWRFTELSNDVGIGELHDDGPASNYPLQHLEPSAGQDGDEIQVKE
ncbi:hypothetical protein B0H65DRAFT_77051 [Neurospora tetraspora]|uniref:Uncharacterized protein n=1 Tax=Neurospora tetraspora TaxID=94610 RepID=A0AAE0J122_9PEZI|nr:hypothetical protein B0H65DRAFT_77051 [Neurospora tetraspora]